MEMFSTSHGVHFSQPICFVRVCVNVGDFNNIFFGLAMGTINLVKLFPNFITDIQS